MLSTTPQTDALTASRLAAQEAIPVLAASFADLLDPENWHPEDRPPTVGSLATLKRLASVSLAKPSLGATYDGEFIAAWTTPAERLTVVCQTDGGLKWVRLLREGNKPRISSGHTSANCEAP